MPGRRTTEDAWSAAADLRPGDDFAVIALERGMQVGAGGRHAPAVAGGNLVIADALLAFAVEIRVEVEAALLRGGEKTLA